MSIFDMFKKPSGGNEGMVIDIRADVPDFVAYIRQRVGQHLASTPPAELIGVINLGWEMGQGNMVWLMLDTRPNATPDGTWSLPKTLEKTPRLDRPQWPLFADVPDGQPVFFIDLQGRKVNVMAGNTDELIHTIAGDALKQALLTARAEGVFHPLPKTAQCKMYVENMEGFYSWPSSKDPAPDNAV